MAWLRDQARGLAARWRRVAGSVAAALALPATGGAASVEVTNNSDVTDGDTASITALQASPGADGVSLREAIIAANNTAGVDDITFATGLSGQSIVLTQGQLELTQGATVDASALAENVVVDANILSRVMQFSGAMGDLSLKKLTLQNGYQGEVEGEYGGGIEFRSTGMLQIDDCRILNNYAYYGGGGIFTRVGNVSMSDTTVAGNDGGEENGGGIYSFDADVTLTNCSVVDNYGYSGGGIFTRNGNLFLSNTTVARNSAQYGGGIHSRDADVTLTNCSVVGNAAYRGGGLFVGSSGKLTATDTDISDNRADENDGGIGGIAGEDIELTNCTLRRNSSVMGAGSLTLVNCEVTDNGDGISVGYGGATLSRCNLANNSGLMLSLYGSGHLVDCTISGNGPVLTSRGPLTMTNCTVAGNSSGITAYSTALEGVSLSNCTIVDNGSVSFSGTGVRVFNGPLTIKNSIVAGTKGTPDAFDVQVLFTGTLTIQNSLIGDNAGTTLAEAQTPDANGNLIGSAAGAGIIDPMLGPLQDNGGVVLTQAPLAGSPVIDAGDNALLPADALDLDGDGNIAEPLPLDAREAVRVNAGTVDMGAVESGAVVADPFQTWIGAFFPGNNDPLVVGPDADPNADGLPNVLAFVLGASPTAADPAKLPTAETVSGSFAVTFRRSDGSAYLNPRVQFGTDLENWDTAEDGMDGVTIVETDDGFGAGIDRVVVTIPAAAGGRLFARLISDLP